jgi:TRAP-type C4-dicarboxylate transport system substrate-binding protein
MFYRTLLMGLTLFFALAPLAQAERVKIKLATMAPKGSAFYQALKNMGDQWRTASDNNVRLKIYPGGVAGGDRDVIRKMKLGTVSAGMITSSGLAAVHKAVHVFQMPATYQSPAELDYLVEKMGKTVADIYEAQGLIILSWGEAGWIRFLSQTPMVHPIDRAEQKMYIVAGNPMQVTLWQAAGFNVVPLPVSEISTGLQTGLITAVPVTAQSALMFQWYKHAPHIMSYAWAPLMGAIVVDKRVWERIEPPLRSKLKRIAETCGKALLAQVRPGEMKALTAMQSRGLQLNETPPDAVTAWQNLATVARSSLRGGYVPTELFDQAQVHLEEFRAKAKAQP